MVARYSEQQKAALDALMKDNVYEKAITIMTGEDLQALTMDRLANEVGVSRGTLYNYFADREAVIDFVVERTFEPLTRAVDEVVNSNLGAEEQVTKIIEWVFSTVYEDRALVVALAPLKQGDCKRESRLARHEGFVKAIENVIRHGVESGAFRNLEPTLVAEILVASIRGMVDSMVDCGEFLPAEKLIPTFEGMLLGGLCEREYAATPR